MTKPTTSSRDADKFVLRMPDGLRSQIADLARGSERSMNAEMISRLRQSIIQEQQVQDQGKLISLLLQKIEHLETRLQEQPLEEVA